MDRQFEATSKGEEVPELGTPNNYIMQIHVPQNI